MTNKDKYLKDGVDVEKFLKEFDEYYDRMAENYIGTKIDFLKAFLQESVKPTLSEDEKVILRNALEGGADAIFRNDGGIYFHTKPGTRGIFGNIFQFIQPRRRI